MENPKMENPSLVVMIFHKLSQPNYIGTVNNLAVLLIVKAQPDGT
jgi:hypothetical protein